MAYDNTIYSVALSDGMPDFLAKAIVAQSKHETDDYTSDAFTQLNNAFGYSFVDRAKWQLPDPGFVADNGLPLAAYASVTNSVHEITDWIKRRQGEGNFPADLNTITSLSQYATLLKNSGYYGDSITNYLNGLVRWFSDNIKPAAGLAIVLLVLIGLYLIMTKK